MAYIGNTPAESYASFETETFTVSATTNYTLSHAVTNENEIRLVINGVVQQPGSGKAYTASGTTLTLSSATASGDVMYAVYLGRALQTVNPPNASVGNSQTAPTIITGQTAETSIATDDTILIHDTSASALRKMTRANFVSGVGGANTPAFEAWLSTDQSASNDTFTKLQCNTEIYDTDSDYDNSSNYRFTPTTAGKFFIYGQTRVDPGTGNLTRLTLSIYKNGSSYKRNDFFLNTGSTAMSLYHGNIVATIDMNGSSDYVELYGRLRTYNGSGISFIGGTAGADTYFGGYKIIT